MKILQDTLCPQPSLWQQYLSVRLCRALTEIASDHDMYHLQAGDEHVSSESDSTLALLLWVPTLILCCRRDWPRHRTACKHRPFEETSN